MLRDIKAAAGKTVWQKDFCAWIGHAAALHSGARSGIASTNEKPPRASHEGEPSSSSSAFAFLLPPLPLLRLRRRRWDLRARFSGPCSSSPDSESEAASSAQDWIDVVPAGGLPG